MGGTCNVQPRHSTLSSQECELADYIVVLVVSCIKVYGFPSGPVTEAEIDVCDLGKSGKNVSRRSKELGPR